MFRGLSKKDELVHAMVSWITLESFRSRVGISLPIQDPVGGDFHEGQLWEQTDEQWVVESDHANYVYSWLANRFTARGSARAFPAGIPESIDEVTVQTRKDGEYGYILFTPEYSLAVPMKKMDFQVIVEYEEWFMKVGMSEAYTIRMLTNEFWELTQQCCEFAPVNGYRREVDGTVVHGVTWDIREHRAIVASDEMIEPPPKILEERGRGTLIRDIKSQGKLFQYWAWAQSPIEVGVYLPETNWKIEYWMSLTLQAVPGDDDPSIYPRILKEMWMQRLREISNGVAQMLETFRDDFGMVTRYLYNNLRG
jgi:hypothetical protein